MRRHRSPRVSCLLSAVLGAHPYLRAARALLCALSTPRPPISLAPRVAPPMARFVSTAAPGSGIHRGATALLRALASGRAPCRLWTAPSGHAASLRPRLLPQGFRSLQIHVRGSSLAALRQRCPARRGLCAPFSRRPPPSSLLVTGWLSLPPRVPGACTAPPRHHLGGCVAAPLPGALQRCMWQAGPTAAYRWPCAAAYVAPAPVLSLPHVSASPLRAFGCFPAAAVARSSWVWRLRISPPLCPAFASGPRPRSCQPVFACSPSSLPLRPGGAVALAVARRWARRLQWFSHA